jgi:hypothetical protein
MQKPKFKVNYFEEWMQVRNSQIIFYALPTNDCPRNRHKLDTPTYSGSMTSHAMKRIKKAVDLLVQFSPPRNIYNSVTMTTEKHTLSFITLTIPGKERHLTAKEGYTLLLSKWIRKMRDAHGLKTYIWKAEFQKNGQLHYHITTNSWIPYTSIRDKWNNIMSSNGMLSVWNEENPTKFPNSTDVHKVYKVKNIQAYLAKYLSKKDKDKSTEGKIWDCSKNLKEAKFFTSTIPNNLDKFIDKKLIRYFDRIGIYELNKGKEEIGPEQFKAYQEWLTPHVQNAL